jgi:putative oxidoreductase
MRHLNRLVSVLLGPTAPVGWVPTVARLALGAVFIPTGLGKFVNHGAYGERFDRWGFPEPGAVAYAVGTIEIVFGLLVLLGIAPRLAGLTLAGNMVGAFFTAGLVDGGQNVWLPPIMFALTATVLMRGGGRWQLPNLVGPGRGPAAGSARLSG